MSITRAGASERTCEYACVFGLAAAAALIIWWRWVGFQGTDDASYALAARQWVEQFPPLGETHWALRYPLVLPMAAIFAVLGETTNTAGLTNLIYDVVFLAAAYLFVRRWFGAAEAAVSVAILVLVPEFTVQATYANPDLPEMIFVMGSLGLFLTARASRPNAWHLAGAGVLAGLGYLCRETTASLILVYGLLFLFRPGMPRGRYLVLAAGFILIVGLVMTYFAVRTGNPFHREFISRYHDQTDRAADLARAVAAGKALDSDGVLAISVFVSPLAVLFASQKFGLLFFLAVPATLWLSRARWPRPEQASIAGTFAALMLASYLFVVLNASQLYVVPRYFIVTAAAAVLPVAIAAVRLWRLGYRRGVGLTAAAFVSSCLLLLYLENTRPLLSETMLLEYATSSGETIYTDPRTAWKSYILAKQRGLETRIRFNPPPPGALVVLKPGAVEECLRGRTCMSADRMEPFVPRPDWVRLAFYPGPERAIAMPLRALGLDQRLTADVWRKIAAPNPGIVVYRVP